jgi:transcriptional regulator with XRE-family HTH domain
MRSPVSRAIRDARLAMGLTQQQLGQYVGLKAHAVYRWEAGFNIPRKAMRRKLLKEVELRKPEAAAQLQATFDTHLTRGGALPALAAVVAPVAPAQPTGALAMELAVFAMADELDLAPRRLRAALPRLLLRMQSAGYSLESARQELDARAARDDARGARETAFPAAAV